MSTIMVRTWAENRDPVTNEIPIYDFGSPELDQLHREMKDGYTNTYTLDASGYRYVVRHRGFELPRPVTPTFYTLQTLYYGRVVPRSQDLVFGADGVLEVACH